MAILAYLLLCLLVLPGSFFIVLVFVMAALGKSLGFRKTYVEFLLLLFNYGKERIERAAKRKEQRQAGEEEEDSDSDDASSEELNENKNSQVEEEILKEEGDSEAVEGEAQDQNQNKTGNFGRDDIFDFRDSFDFIQSGITAIVNDQVTQRFASEELRSWNLLTRTTRNYEFISWRLSLIWLVGFFIRYFFMLPCRVTICFLGTITLTLLTFFIGLLPQSAYRKKLNDYASKFSFRLLSRAFAAIIHYHDEQYRPTKSGICVANHTSPIDVVLLACDSTYAMIGQRHGGFLGILQRALARASSHIWFERSEMKDREAVARRLKEHVEDKTTCPILIFPEGTCINNSAVMQFKKGSFEVGGQIYPVAIKYDPRFGDPFWDSSKYSMLQYLYMMMTSWAIVCDVYYMPPMERRPGESSIDFAKRVKAEIAKKGGLIDLDWDGQLKRAPAKKEWKEQQQVQYAKKLVHSPRHLVQTADDSPNPST
ncbi:unnamed protein product [Allacma fusca]|uniref:Phospholipid/glycerol acyltransferase domain-containing protein n=1 Tax=Allacma fusca TaxID=39272 RepID=A0A8J2LIK2_9HEXA|nr:unnamed protein product [Allacma fusca]